MMWDCRDHFFLFFLSSDFHELWLSAISVCSLKLSTGMGHGISLCHHTFIISSALLMSLMAVQLAHLDKKTFRPCFLNGPGHKQPPDNSN